MKQFLCFVSISLYVTIMVFSQTSQEELVDPNTVNQNTLLALSSPDYRVTAGDIYTLAYAAGGTPVVYQIIVDSTYRIQISNLGLINAAGKTYRQLKTEAETIVSNNYPLSGAQLVLTQPAFFKVRITGEVSILTEPTTWALARLSSLLNVYNVLTAYSSIRDITVTSSSGQSKTYDLFKAQRYGELSQDPYLRPGDTIRINRIDRVVSVNGSVERPGEYQLLPGEELSDLITRYASGLTPTADPSRIELVRYVETETDSGDKLYLSEQDIDNNYPLHHLDAVTVPTIIDLIPVMFVEGAVRVSQEGVNLDTSTRLTVRFNAGENYASLVQRNKEWFSAISDTLNAYLIRGEQRIPMNLNPMLYDSSYRSQYSVLANDILIVPFRQYFVTVAGAVNVSGRYPYIPDRTWEYYIALAGGFNPNLNVRDKITITDIAGKKLSKNDPITPETIIMADTNSGLYAFNRFAPVVTTILSIISTFITVTLLITK